MILLLDGSDWLNIFDQVHRSRSFKDEEETGLKLYFLEYRSERDLAKVMGESIEEVSKFDDSAIMVRRWSPSAFAPVLGRQQPQCSCEASSTRLCDRLSFPLIHRTFVMQCSHNISGECTLKMIPSCYFKYESLKLEPRERKVCGCTCFLCFQVHNHRQRPNTGPKDCYHTRSHPNRWQKSCVSVR